MTSMTALFAPTPVAVNLSAHAGRASALVNLPLLDRPEAASQFSLQSYPLHGSVSLEADGRLLYVAKSGYVGPDRFSYSVGDANSAAPVMTMVNIMVEHSSLSVCAARWAHFALRNDTMLIIPEAAMLRAKPDATIDGLSVVNVEQPRHGKVCRRADGSYSYTPKAGYVGDDAFDYLVLDAKGGRALVMVKLNLSAPTAAPTIELLPAQQADVCDRLLSNAPVGALLPTLQGLATPGSQVTVVVDGHAVARVAANSQGRWAYSSELLSLRGASHLQAYVHSPDGSVAATSRLSGKAAMAEAFGSSGSGYWASCTSRSHRSGYHSKSAMVPGGYHGSVPAWAERSLVGPTGWGSR